MATASLNRAGKTAGEIVICIQHDSRGPELGRNWLPAPDGLMFAVMRLYPPEAEALDGRWESAPVENASRRPGF